MMQTFCRSLLCVVGMALLVNPALAQEPPKDTSAGNSKANLFSIPGVGDMVQAAGDLRKAGEAFERFGESLRRIASTIAQGLVESSKNHAIMSGAFDPFGFKTAFATIREQNRTIQALHKAETRSLKKECRRLKKKIERSKRKMKKWKKDKQ